MSTPFGIDVKRMCWPGSITSTCPNCKHEQVEWGSDRPLGYPTANVPFDFHLCCEECDTEWPVKVILHVSLEVLPVTG